MSAVAESNVVCGDTVVGSDGIKVSGGNAGACMRLSQVLLVQSMIDACGVGGGSRISASLRVDGEGKDERSRRDETGSMRSSCFT